PHAVDALLELGGLDEVVEVVVRGLGHEAIDLDLPWLYRERVCVPERILLVGAKLVVVVVARDVLERCDRLARRGQSALACLQRGRCGSPAAHRSDRRAETES